MPNCVYYYDLVTAGEQAGQEAKFKTLGINGDLLSPEKPDILKPAIILMNLSMPTRRGIGSKLTRFTLEELTP